MHNRINLYKAVKTRKKVWALMQEIKLKEIKEIKWMHTNYFI